MQPNSFPELLERLARSDGDAHRYHDGSSTTELTYGDLIAEADDIARGIQRLRSSPAIEWGSCSTNREISSRHFSVVCEEASYQCPFFLRRPSADSTRG